MDDHDGRRVKIRNVGYQRLREEGRGVVAQVEVFPDRSGLYRFRIKARNGEIIAQSEAYSTQDNAARGAATLIEEAALLHAHPPVKVEFYSSGPAAVS